MTTRAREPPPSAPKVAYTTTKGTLYEATVEQFLASDAAEAIRGKVDLIFTSPPFPLKRKKKYGNKEGQAYLDWIGGLAKPLADLLSPKGSIVVEVGNAWEPGRPVMSTLTMESLLRFRKDADLSLCQQFVCHNPARLPAPAQWVNIERIRVKDSYTHVWWFANTDRPYANNRNVLRPYSDAMKQLLETQSYNSGLRPSEYQVNATSFLTKHRGSIPPSAIDVGLSPPNLQEWIQEHQLPASFLKYANTASRDAYLDHCRDQGLSIHPARMSPHLVEFFVKFLTKKNGLVFDPFGGSNTTGAVAESLGRRWISCEPNPDYAAGSAGRFVQAKSKGKTARIKIVEP